MLQHQHVFAALCVCADSLVLKLADTLVPVTTAWFFGLATSVVALAKPLALAENSEASRLEAMPVGVSRVHMRFIPVHTSGF